jgi:hypothetical protein
VRRKARSTRQQLEDRKAKASKVTPEMDNYLNTTIRPAAVNAIVRYCLLEYAFPIPDECRNVVEDLIYRELEEKGYTRERDNQQYVAKLMSEKSVCLTFPFLSDFKDI